MGEAVRDLQRRLEHLGFEPRPSESGVFGAATEDAVRRFQEQRGLWVDGECGRETWNALVEAGRVLGERLLYYRREMLRGDDVAALQRQLGALGFDAGRVDGIFGPETHRAVEDFQLNTGLPVDGICGPSTLQALARVSSRADGDAVVAEVRERARLRGTPRTLFGCRVAIGEPGGLSSLAESTRRMVARMGASPLTLHDPDESAQAVQANANGAEVYLGLRLDPEGEGCRTAYFLGHSGYRSEGGHRLAHLALESVCRAVDVKGLGCRGMSVPILRETRMPAVLVELAPPRVVVEEANLVALGLSRALAAWVADPCPD